MSVSAYLCSLSRMRRAIERVMRPAPRRRAVKRASAPVATVTAIGAPAPVVLPAWLADSVAEGLITEVEAYGIPDDWTALPGAKDSPRYHALGNSKAVPVVRWIGRRIEMVDSILRRAA